MLKRMMLAGATVALASSAPATAQMAVFDVKSYAQIVQQLKAAQDQLAVVTKTYNQAVDAYNDVHGLTNVDGVAQLLNSDASKKWLPSGARDIEQLATSSSSSLGTFGQQAANIRAGRKVNLPALPGSATDADRSRRAALEAAGDTAAKNAAIADAAYGATATRSAGLDQLQQALASATTEKDRQAIQARIGIEVARIQNDTMQLQAVKMRQ
ncbi:type IV secretion system protein, partial [Sphingomonas sp. PAMC 26605]|uniref:type IV secretion system protein n=1 Tax=Sphingomonas sp. PAMC 26605 TaxID=1112214 RepID=UPI00026CD83A